MSALSDRMTDHTQVSEQAAAEVAVVAGVPSSATVVQIASQASSLVALSFSLRFHADYARLESMVVPYTAVPKSDEAYFVLRFMQRRMKIGFTSMTPDGYAFYKRIPASASVAIPRLSDEMYATCRAIVFTLSNAPRALQTDDVANAIVGANDVAIKQARFLVRLYCTRPDLTVGGGGAKATAAASDEADGTDSSDVLLEAAAAAAAAGGSNQQNDA